MENSLLVSEDGSSTLYNPMFDDTYHSIHGAITESNLVYIQNGFCQAEENFNSSLNILEIGFGTGLNALLTALACEKLMRKVNYQTIEAFPISIEMIKGLNYPELLNKPFAKEYFKSIHQCNWEIPIEINRFFTFWKQKTTLEQAEIIENSMDVVYYDAFGPSKQGEMWTPEILEKVALSVRKKGVFVTYSTNGVLKRVLKSLEFKVEKVQGPPGKREVLKAIKQ